MVRAGARELQRLQSSLRSTDDVASVASTAPARHGWFEFSPVRFLNEGHLLQLLRANTIAPELAGMLLKIMRSERKPTRWSSFELELTKLARLHSPGGVEQFQQRCQGALCQTNFALDTRIG